MLAYFVAVVLLGALLAPPLFWGAQALAAQGGPDLTGYGFRSFFHRALLLAALALLYPLWRSLEIRRLSDLDLVPNPRGGRDAATGFCLAALPLAAAAGLLVLLDVYLIRTNPRWSGLGQVALAALIVPVIEEFFFRGFLLGLFARRAQATLGLLLTSAFYSVIHFLKAPEVADQPVFWQSGFALAGQGFHSFQTEPGETWAACATLFVLGLIMGVARWRTRSLWLPIGLHAGWILANGAFNKMARLDSPAWPWIGDNLRLGVVPVLVALITWGALIFYLKKTGRHAR